MKLPWFVSQHLGGVAKAALGASPKFVWTMYWAPPYDVVLVAPDVHHVWKAVLTVGSVNGISWLTHLS